MYNNDLKALGIKNNRFIMLRLRQISFLKLLIIYLLIIEQEVKWKKLSKIKVF